MAKFQNCQVSKLLTFKIAKFQTLLKMNMSNFDKFSNFDNFFNFPTFSNFLTLVKFLTLINF